MRTRVSLGGVHRHFKGKDKGTAGEVDAVGASDIGVADEEMEMTAGSVLAAYHGVV
jgi:hypothetical protein